MLEGKELDKTTPIPLYFQLKSLILEEIKNGSYPEGSLIPTEIELSSMFNISRTTVRQAITELVQEGYLYRVKSKGTFVSRPKIEQQLLDHTFSYDEEVSLAGRVPTSKFISREIVPVPEELVRRGYAQEGEKAICVYRMRYADDMATMRGWSYFPLSQFPEVERMTEAQAASINPRHLLARYAHLHSKHVVRTLEAVPASQDDMDLMKIASGEAIMIISTIQLDESEQYLCYSKNFYRGDQNRVTLDSPD